MVCSKHVPNSDLPHESAAAIPSPPSPAFLALTPHRKSRDKRVSTKPLDHAPFIHATASTSAHTFVSPSHTSATARAPREMPCRSTSVCTAAPSVLNTQLTLMLSKPKSLSWASLHPQLPTGSSLCATVPLTTKGPCSFSPPRFPSVFSPGTASLPLPPRVHVACIHLMQGWTVYEFPIFSLHQPMAEFKSRVQLSLISRVPRAWQSASHRKTPKSLLD